MKLTIIIWTLNEVFVNSLIFFSNIIYPIYPVQIWTGLPKNEDLKIKGTIYNWLIVMIEKIDIEQIFAYYKNIPVRYS